MPVCNRMDDSFELEKEDKISEVKQKPKKKKSSKSNAKSTDAHCYICKIIRENNESNFNDENSSNIDDEVLKKALESLTCPYCDFSTKQTGSLIVHIKSHITCKKCNKTWSGKCASQKFKRHQKTCSNPNTNTPKPTYR